MGVKIINLEEGLPTVQEAKLILEQELVRARKAKVKTLKLIHGYGSKGTGGKIRTAIIRLLTEKKNRNEIRDFIPGDKWSIFNKTSRSVIDVCPVMSKDSDLENCNIGITIVIMK